MGESQDGPDRVDLWLTRTEGFSAAQVSHLTGFLSAEERDRAKAFRFEKDRTQSIVARALLRTLLGRELSIDPSALQFQNTEFGRPVLVPDSALQFNVSHSGNLILIGTTRLGAIGVDVEQIRADVPNLDLARTVFTPQEIEEWISHDRSAEFFFDLWTLKESYIKAVGLGLSAPVKSICFKSPGEKPLLVASHSESDDTSQWNFYRISVGDEYRAAATVLNVDRRGIAWRVKTVEGSEFEDLSGGD